MNATAEALEPLHVHAAGNLVETHPGETAAQLADRARTDRETMLDLLYAAQKDGRVYCAELRSCCPITGRVANVWRPGRNPQLSYKPAADAA